MSNQLHLQEVVALRSELNSVIDRMNGNENFSAGTISAIFAFILSSETSFISLVLSALSIIVVIIGAIRYRELRAQVHRLDNYIASIEKIISDKGGWTNYYYKSIAKSPSSGYSRTRLFFWGALFSTSFLGNIYIIYSLCCLPDKMDVLCPIILDLVE